jgi:hypothetical protein
VTEESETFVKLLNFKIAVLALLENHHQGWYSQNLLRSFLQRVKLKFKNPNSTSLVVMPLGQNNDIISYIGHNISIF